MTREQIDNLRRTARAATPGPYVFIDSSDSRGRKGEFRAPSPHNGFMLVGPWTNNADPRFMELACNVLPELLSALAEREAEVERLRKLCLQAAANIEANTRDIDADDHLIQSLRAASNADGGKEDKRGE